MIPVSSGDDNLSIIEQLALLPDDERDALIKDLTPADMASAELWLRPRQLEVLHSEAWVTLFLAGRGAGKSRTGAHWVIEKARTPGTRIALLGRTVGDVRDVMVSGESGILAVSGDDFMPDYTPSTRTLVWPNGSVAKTYSAETPAQLRGPQQHCAWADEVAAFKHVPDNSGLTAWDNLQISTRLGEAPQVLATTTPKRTAVIRDLVKQAKLDPRRVKLVTGSTLDNRANLSADYVQQIYDRYAGTALERQELFGEFVDEVEGALWRESDIKIQALPEGHETDMATIVAVDPGVTSGGDATGIVVIKTTLERDLNARTVWIVEDSTVQGPPELWASMVANARRRWSTGVHQALVVVEGNQGMELLTNILWQEEKGMPIAIVRADKSKAVRAEPIVFAYRRNRIFHTEHHDELEQEMFDWEPDVSKWSPNRIDAMVHAVTAAVIDPRPLRKFSPILVGNMAGAATLGSAVPGHRQNRGSGLSVAPWRERVPGGTFR